MNRLATPGAGGAPGGRKPSHGRWREGRLPAFGFDPYWYFAHLIGHAHLARTTNAPIPLLLKLGPRSTAYDFACMGADAPYWRKQLVVPMLYHSLPRELQASAFCTAFAQPGFFEQLGEPSLQATIAQWELCLPWSVPADSDIRKPTFDVGNARKGAVVGIIDDALAFAHARFRRTARKTRVLAFWDQGFRPAPAPAYPGYGRMRKQSEIDDLLDKHTHAALVDEDALYAEVGNTRVARRAGHGTHVMDIACGADYPGSSGEAPHIVAVQLPGHVTRDTSGYSLSGYALDGIHYIVQATQALSAKGSPRPIVVNLSYGMIAGPHDGGSLLEQALDEILALYNAAHARAPLRVVLPSGNSHLARCHASLTLADGASDELAWRIPPDDWTPSFMEIWLPSSLAQPRAVAVTLTPPGAPTGPAVGPGQFAIWETAKNLLAAVLYPANPLSNGRHMILVVVVPTFELDGVRDVAPPGTWTVGFTHTDGQGALTIDAWIQRDDTPFGFPRRGRQSRFEDPDYVRRDPRGELLEVDAVAGYCRRAGSTNALATGHSPVVVGGVRLDRERPAPYSAGGPTIPPPVVVGPPRTGPDVSAPSEHSRVRGSVLAAGTRSRSIVGMYGTSVAAPAITRWIAAEMAAGRAAQTDRAGVAAAATAPADWPPTERGGAGIVPETKDYRMTGVGRDEPS